MDININVESEQITVNQIWLRDNCRCQFCYNELTHQRKSDSIDIENIYVKTFSQIGDQIIITCECISGNDDHYSEYSCKWIKRQMLGEEIPQPIIWEKDEIQRYPKTIDNNKINTTDGQRFLIQSILKFGVALVPMTSEIVENTVRHIGPIMQTLYGNIWTTSTRELHKYQDTAYTNEELAVHTDCTYFNESPGLQVFHCFQPAVNEGHTILVDGFKAANLLKEQCEDDYKCLTTVPTEWQYTANEYEHKNVKPILELDQITQHLKQVRYNIYDRSSRMPHTQNTEKFYRSLHNFGKIIKNPQLEWRIKLTPDIMLFVNNWRVLHGRSAFQGERSIRGCYIQMSTLLSKARLLKIIK